MPPTCLPIDPFRAWLRDELRRNGGHIGDFARLLGVHERRLWGWLHQNAGVPLAAVDHALTTYGEPALLNELYPVDDKTEAA